MKNFIYNTVIGGIFFLIPLFVLFKIINLIVNYLKNLGPNIVKYLGFSHLESLAKSSYSAVILFILICFIFGLIARWTAATKARNWFESKITSIFPTYDYYKAIIEKNLKIKEEVSRDVVLLKNNAVLKIGIVTQELSNNLVCVYIPFAPNTNNGEISIVNAKEIVKLNLTEKELNTILLKSGNGLNILIENKDFL